MIQDAVVVVTGGSGGIGGAIAEALAPGASTIVLQHHCDGQRATEVAGRLSATGASVETVDADLAQPRRAGSLVEQAIEAHGRVDVLINAAGVMREWVPQEERHEDWERTIAVNLTATFSASQAAAPAMAEAGSGAIVNLASQLAFKGAPGLSAYCASKAGVVGLTRSMAREYGPAVRLYALAPGPVDTAMIAEYADKQWREERVASLIANRIAQPDEIAEVARFAVADEAGLLQGQTLHCNGGGVLA